MSEPTVITEDRVVLTRRIAELEEQISGCCADAEVAGYMGENLDSAAQCFREKIAEQTARIAELEAALGALVIVCPEEGDSRIMMISLSGQAMTNANLEYVAIYGRKLSAARKALEVKDV